MRIVWLIALLIAPIYSRDVVSKVYFHMTLSCMHNFQNDYTFNIRFFKKHSLYDENAITPRYKGGRLPAQRQITGVYEATVTGPEGSEYEMAVSIQHECRFDPIADDTIIFFIGTCKIRADRPCHVYHFVELRHKPWKNEERPRIVQ